MSDKPEHLWVTYEVEQAASMLATQRVICAHHPTTKNIPNALRNYWLARRVFREHDVEHVVSTGAAIAVPFMIRARQLGIPCHYIESATRTDGPSLSGRLLQGLRGVHLYRQFGRWGAPRWKHGPCVFDGFTASSARARSLSSVVVSLGTHGFGFPALVERLARCLRDSDARVLWQLGATPDPGYLPGEVVRMLPSHELAAVTAEADVVVGHAGVGLVMTALAAGKVPVISPRRRARKEHTDDHQVQLARELSGRGLAIVVEVDDLTLEHLEQAARRTVSYEDPQPFELAD